MTTTRLWKCSVCKVAFDLDDRERIRKHLNTKKHKRLQWACPTCSSLRMVDLNETWDRDGIRKAKKCQRCLTEYKTYADGIYEKDPHEYTEQRPLRIIEQERQEFDRIARANGYVPANEIKADTVYRLKTRFKSSVFFLEHGIFSTSDKAKKYVEKHKHRIVDWEIIPVKLNDPSQKIF